MAVDNRPFKSKEQDGQGNEVIIRDQQLVEQGTATTMASGAYFETRDVDDRPVKIPRDNMMNIVLECIGIILNDSSRNLGTNVQKALGLQGNTVGHSTVADFASVLGVVANALPTEVLNGNSGSPDFNNCMTRGITHYISGQSITNCPVNICGPWGLVVNGGYAETRRLQFCVGDAGIGFRVKDGDNWGTWHSIPFS